MSSAETSPLSGLSLLPAAPARSWRRDADFVAEALHAHCELRGWFLPAEEATGILGIRAVLSDGTAIAARRKQLRPDIHQQHPARKDALHSGFYVPLVLKSGWNRVILEYRDAGKKWHVFNRTDLKLSRFWQIKSRWQSRLPQNDYEQWLGRNAARFANEVSDLQRRLATWSKPPVISLLMPTYNTPERWLRRCMQSVKQQLYPHWELCIADDCSTASHVRPCLERAAASDKRIKVAFRRENGHICKASNTALELCTGEFTALLDHDDELPPDALLRVAGCLMEQPETDMIFSDEDKIDERGIRSDPFFKPGFNHEMLLHENCFSHLGVFRSSLLRLIGGFRPGWEGSQDWDLTLRALSRTDRTRVRHIPRVLYHWRTLATSTSSSLAAKPYASDAGLRAVAGHLEAQQTGAVVEPSSGSCWHIRWPLPEPLPCASIIIPTHDRVDLLEKAVSTLLANTSYGKYEIIIVDHDSQLPETAVFLDELCLKEPRVRVLRETGPFNWSRLNNRGARMAAGEVLVFLNNDVEITDGGWLTELVSHACRPDVGAVGACLLYPDGNIQHAGVVLGMIGIAGHVFRQASLQARTMAGHPALPREVTAVTGACLAVRREHFEGVGGFDEENLPISYNDIDFCLKLRAKGLRNLYAAHAKLIHHESVSRASLEKQSARKAAATEEARIMLERWPAELAQDANYSPQLSRDSEQPAF